MLVLVFISVCCKKTPTTITVNGAAALLVLLVGLFVVVAVEEVCGDDAINLFSLDEVDECTGDVSALQIDEWRLEDKCECNWFLNLALRFEFVKGGFRSSAFDIFTVRRDFIRGLRLDCEVVQRDLNVVRQTIVDDLSSEHRPVRVFQL